jgi:hypothetical protein
VIQTGRDSLRLFLQLKSTASSIIIGDRLPRNGMGKLSDWRPEDFPAVTGRFRHAWPESLDSPAALQ